MDMYDFKPITTTLIAGNEDKLLGLLEKALDQGIPAEDILNSGLIAGMDIVGEKMATEEMFIPEVLMSANVMDKCVKVLEHQLGGKVLTSRGKVVIGTVAGDLHDIGKNLVAMMLESSGFATIDLGTNVTPGQFIEAINTHKPDIVGMSALLTTTMPMMAETVQALNSAGIRDQVKIICGGAPVSQDFVDKIGADEYGADAGKSIEKCKVLLMD